jgi:glycosyltransferase involved in cell wall biosynthesis
MNETTPPSLCILTTVSFSIKAFYPGQLEGFNQAGFKTTVICAHDPDLPSCLPAETEYIPLSFTRVASPWQDLKTLYRLFKLFRQRKFDIVQYSTPKAALLGAFAALAARVPVRIYILWGLYYMGQTGIKKYILKSLEKLICFVSTHITPISHEMVKFIESEGLTNASKCEVMLQGSACGVDLERFDPIKHQSAGREIRRQLHIKENDIVIGTVARITGDKGINELITSFHYISQAMSNVHLLLVGDQEEKDRLLPKNQKLIDSHPRIHHAGLQMDPLAYYMAMNIFCLPTYREGFGEVNLEAQAMGLPVVSTNVIGPRESVENEVTGFLVEPRNSEALISPLEKLLKDADLRADMGRQGRARVEAMFNRKAMIHAVVQHRLNLLGKVK